jgi:hypothetical protein
MSGPFDLHPKVAVGGLAAALVSLGVYALGLAGVDVPPVIAAEITTVVGIAAGYLKKSQPKPAQRPRRRKKKTPATTTGVRG